MDSTILAFPNYWIYHVKLILIFNLSTNNLDKGGKFYGETKVNFLIQNNY